MDQTIESLSDTELLKLIIGRSEIVKRFSDENPDLYRTLANLRDMPLKVSGLTARCKEQLTAAVELGKRLAKGKLPDLQTFTEPSAIALYLASDLQYLEKEVFVVLSLNSRCKLIGKDIVSIGTVTNSLVSPREVLINVMRHNATMFIIAHNHPSGEPTPSMDDIKITDNLKNAAKLLGIQLLDHIIIGNGEYYSFKEKEESKDGENFGKN